MVVLPPLNTKLTDLNADEIWDIFEKMPVKADYLDCQRFKGYSMTLDPVVCDYDCGINNVLIVDSPNFPEAGKGLILNRKHPMTEETGLPYWGEVFVHFYERINIEDIPLEKHFSERLIRL